MELALALALTLTLTLALVLVLALALLPAPLWELLQVWDPGACVFHIRVDETFGKSVSRQHRYVKIISSHSSSVIMSSPIGSKLSTIRHRWPFVKDQPPFES